MKLKRSIVVFALVSILILSFSLSLAGCTTAEEEVKTLTVVNWKDYGSDDPAVVAAFEKANNCKVVHQYMESEEDLLTKLKTAGKGEIDVVLPNASILPTAISEGLVAEIDTTKLTNYPNIFDKFKDLEENQKDGKIYAVPWVWGSTAIAYNTNLIKEEITSMNVLFDPKYAGHISIRDDFNDAVMAAAIVLGQDPNDPSDLNAIKAKLIEQKPLNKTYWKTGDEFSQLFASEQIWVGMMWSGQAASMKKNGEPIQFVVPDDGAIGWVDTFAIAETSENKELALKFIDYMISEGFQKDWVESGGPAPVNQKVADGLTEEFKKDAGMSEEDLQKLYFISYHTQDVKTQWNELWQEVKSE